LLIHPPSKTACRQVYQGIRFSGFRGSLIFGLLQGGGWYKPRIIFRAPSKRAPPLERATLSLFGIPGPWVVHRVRSYQRTVGPRLVMASIAGDNFICRRRHGVCGDLDM
jgi:hypothetical protein